MALSFVQSAPLMITVTKPVNMVDSHTDMSLWYALRGDRQQPLDFDRGEVAEIRWFAFDALPREHVEAHLSSCIAKLSALC